MHFHGCELTRDLGLVSFWMGIFSSNSHLPLLPFEPLGVGSQPIIFYLNILVI
jgi:hypothetical protein